ncbi:hypothetical protein LQW54_003729 [Pestalotiopsis sp. IQ-011]
MAPWSDDEKGKLVELITELGDLSRPSSGSLGVVKNWPGVVDAFNQGKDEDDAEYRTKNSMHRSAKFILNTTKDIDFDFPDDNTYGAMLQQIYEHSLGVQDADTPPADPASAAASPAPRSIDEDGQSQQLDRSIEQTLDRISDELLDILADIKDKAERDRLIDYFNQKFHD